VHVTARRGLLRLLTGVGVLALVVVVALLVLRSCRSDEERISDLVDEGRDALVDRNREAFLAFFADDVVYRGKPDRKGLERDLDRYIDARVVRVSVGEREITVDGDTATARLGVDVGYLFQEGRRTQVDVRFERQDGEWRVVSLDRTRVPGE